jgi:hypothetical protein
LGPQIGFQANGDWTDQWWWGKGYGSVKVRVRKDSTASAASSAASSEDSDSDSDADDGKRKSAGEQTAFGSMTEAALLKLCGGRRLGMRARAKQRGKWKRAEMAVEAAVQAATALAEDSDGAGADDGDPDAAFEKRRRAMAAAAAGGLAEAVSNATRAGKRPRAGESAETSPVKASAEGARHRRYRVAEVRIVSAMLRAAGRAGAKDTDVSASEAALDAVAADHERFGKPKRAKAERAAKRAAKAEKKVAKEERKAKKALRKSKKQSKK